jgi:hypothetical protein
MGEPMGVKAVTHTLNDMGDVRVARSGRVLWFQFPSPPSLPCAFLDEEWPLVRTCTQQCPLLFRECLPIWWPRSGPRNRPRALGINDGLWVPSDAHLHHAGVLCVPQLWLL